jgi:hypothetical protein
MMEDVQKEHRKREAAGEKSGDSEDYVENMTLLHGFTTS